MESVATRTVDAQQERFAATEGNPAEASLTQPAKNIAVLLFGEPGRLFVWTLGLSLLVTTTSLSVTAAIAFVVAAAVGRLFITLVESRPMYLNRYDVRRTSNDVVKREAFFSVMLIAAVYLPALPVSRESVALFIIGNLVAQLLLLGTARIGLQILCTQAKENSDATQQVIIIGTGKRARDCADHIIDHPELQSSVVGFLDFNRSNLWRYRDIALKGHPDQLRDIIAANQVDLILIAVGPEDTTGLRSVMATAEKMGIPVAFLPDMFRFGDRPVKTEWFGNQPAIVYQQVSDDRLRLFAKWIIDKFGAIVGIILTAPLIIGVAIAIKCDSRGPILFKQRRTGRNGKPFDLYKFRTMCCDAEHMKRALAKQNEMSGPVFKITDDPRVTRIGRILRKYSIDEVPQFFNVLKGDMSLVGPRPPLPCEVLQYKSWQHRRLSVQPGITCSWQVSGRNNIDFEDWMRLDLDYIDSWSLKKDASLLVRTIPAVLKCDGAS